MFIASLYFQSMSHFKKISVDFQEGMVSVCIQNDKCLIIILEAISPNVWHEIGIFIIVMSHNCRLPSIMMLTQLLNIRDNQTIRALHLPSIFALLG